jgi:hypothetical protein
MALAAESVKFMGFKRDGRRPGIRNDLWIFPTSPGVCGTLSDLRDGYHKPYWIDSVSVLDEASFALAEGDIIMGLAANPNVCGVLFAGPADGSAYVKTLSHARSMVIACPRPSEDEANLFGVILDGLAADVTRTRVRLGLSYLRSGIVLDPNLPDFRLKTLAYGLMDWLTQNGGRVLRSGIRDPKSALALASSGAQIILNVAMDSEAFPCTVPVIAVLPHDAEESLEKALEDLTARIIMTASGNKAAIP